MEDFDQSTPELEDEGGFGNAEGERKEQEEDPELAISMWADMTKIRDVSESINQLASEMLAAEAESGSPNRSRNNLKSSMEEQASELIKALKRLCSSPDLSSGDDSDSAKSPRLPPPLVRPRRHRRKKNEEPEEVKEVQKKRTIMSGELYCHSCGTLDTPEWRRGPDGCKSLCNACGLHYAKILKRETMIPNRQTQRTSMCLNNLLN